MVSLQYGRPALVRAALWRRPDLVRELLHEGADPTESTSGGETALFSAVRGGHLYKAEFLLDNGAAVDKEVWGRTALHEAVRVGAVDLMRLLLKHGANPNLIAKNGQTALHFAAVNGHPGAVELLVEEGVNLNAEDTLGWSALHWAAYKGHSNIVDLLLEHGANTTKLTTREGASPLICAVARQDCDSTARLEIIRALLEHGAQPNGQDGDGETPLHFAVSFLEYDVAQVLLENGADPTIRTHYSITVGDNNFAAGSTPLHYAHQLGAENLIRLIASYAGSSDNSDWQFSYRTNLCNVNMMRDSNGHTPVQLHPRWPCYMI
ncbi:ankyrin repeat domain containing protein [Perkinsus marinus ATCC 50983]|uniref:Ankyrin repeat domain containing protein n=1 Tax=Perkinsus marinus (strain ATCC 50983 / TXsc) TaxID=423536 RepID=C5KQ45_PERM5|nr:ankyrin repeat domain containing protein [Perkinsus marinus ATCC 50983]EER13400.1 ankyrin repeat domain containing protein [Perkinsus marinus ATCC 50983]|eukprot:XP_002781605.1 ankyrin repeat domain containing protein [Perkinsus marinus ATCC 50983]